ncbi:MAG: methyltransferase [Shimia sp.]|uniref:methyltransferase n=1 Tax=Shimia sp. TaxID=1954381 RepID=UPI00405A2DEA
MAKLEDIRMRSTWRDMLEGQPQHLGLIVFLFLGATALLVASPGGHRFFGLTAQTWAVTSIGLAILHQVIVAFIFRAELHRNLVTRLHGDADLAIWTRVFLPLLAARPITILITGLADDVPIGTPHWLNIGLGISFVAIAIYGMHSVLTYFTIRRAVGGDHFREETAALPLVKDGIFKYTSNAMYGPIFLGLWGIALLCDSWNALVVAAFQHVYIWVHYYCTEKPDMEWIYGNR